MFIPAELKATCSRILIIVVTAQSNSFTSTASSPFNSLCLLEIPSKSSILYWANRNNIPVFVPGLTDGAVGSQLWLFSQNHRDFKINLLKDETYLSDIVFDTKNSGALMIGGGISKHHTLWWNQFKGGLDFAVNITSASEWDGSLSGAAVREAVSWGKVKMKARKVTVRGEATAMLPFMVESLLSRLNNS